NLAQQLVFANGGRFQRRFQARLCARPRSHEPNGDLVHEQQRLHRRRLWPDYSAVILRAFYTGGVWSRSPGTYDVLGEATLSMCNYVFATQIYIGSAVFQLK